jgi:hypothetical protein
VADASTAATEIALRNILECIVTSQAEAGSLKNARRTAAGARDESANRNFV